VLRSLPLAGFDAAGKIGGGRRVGFVLRLLPPRRVRLSPA